MPLTAAIVALVVLSLAVVVSLVLLLRRDRVQAAADPFPALLQQQLTALDRRLADLAAGVPRDVGAAVTGLAGQVGARLAENALAMQAMGAETGRLIADLSHRVGELGRSSQQILDLGRDIRGLQRIFEAPKARGALGEMSLGLLLGQSFPAEHVRLQHEFRSGDRVDALLRLPGGGVPIDAKFPLAQFRAALDTPGDEARARALRGFGRDVRRHIDDIAAKYIRPAEGTLDFALMYIPAESVFYEVIIRDAGEPGEELGDYALRRRVVPVSPNSLYAYLQAIGFGLMGLRIEARARDILAGLRQVQGDLDHLRSAFDLGQKHLRNAQTQFGEAADRFARLEAQVAQFARAADSTAGGGAAPPPGPEPERPALRGEA